MRSPRCMFLISSRICLNLAQDFGQLCGCRVSRRDDHEELPGEVRVRARPVCPACCLRIAAWIAAKRQPGVLSHRWQKITIFSTLPARRWSMERTRAQGLLAASPAKTTGPAPGGIVDDRVVAVAAPRYAAAADVIGRARHGSTSGSHPARLCRCARTIGPGLPR